MQCFGVKINAVTIIDAVSSLEVSSSGGTVIDSAKCVQTLPSASLVLMTVLSTCLVGKSLLLYQVTAILLPHTHTNSEWSTNRLSIPNGRSMSQQGCQLLSW